MMGVAATFHYENGLHANIPAQRERECFDAWSQAWTLLPNDIEPSGTFRAAGAPGAAAVLKSPRSGEWVGAWEVQRGNEVWVLVAGPGAAAAELSWAEGWRQVDERRWSASRLLHAVR
jgi:hypothetical protein